MMNKVRADLRLVRRDGKIHHNSTALVRVQLDWFCYTRGEDITALHGQQAPGYSLSLPVNLLHTSIGTQLMIWPGHSTGRFTSPL